MSSGTPPPGTPPTPPPGAPRSPAGPADPQVDVDPCGQRTFLNTQYLDAFLAEGGAKLKLVLGPEGSGKTHFLHSLATGARRRGYLVAAVDAAGDPLWGFDNLYRAAVGSIDLSELGRTFAARLCASLGYEGCTLAEGEDLGTWARAAGHAEAPLRVRVDEAIHEQLVTNADFDRGYAIGLRHWLDRLLWGGVRDDLLLIDSWLRGSRVSARECNRLHLRRSADRFSGRVWLRSFLRFARRAGRLGLLLTVDGLEALLVRGRPAPGASGTSPPALNYTKVRRDDFYESLRAVIDDMADMPGLLLCLAGPPALLADERRGIASYPALALRMQNEVGTAELNRFADEVVLERLWEADPAARTELAVDWLAHVRPMAPDDLRTRALAAAEAEWHAAQAPGTSAVRRSIEAVRRAAGERPDEPPRDATGETVRETAGTSAGDPAGEATGATAGDAGRPTPDVTAGDSAYGTVGDAEPPEGST